VRDNAGGIVTVEVAGLGPVRVAATSAIATGRPGSIALRPEKIRIQAAAPADTPDNHCQGTVSDLLYMGDVTVYKVDTPAGRRSRRCSPIRRPAAPSSSRSATRSKMSWPVAAGHFIEA